MPLFDHFRPPINRIVRWDSIHGGWPMKIVEALFPLLSEQFVAAPKVHLAGGIEIDVGTFQLDQANDQPMPDRSYQEWLAVTPTLTIDTETAAAEEYSVQVYDLDRERELIASIEIVSPANKDRRDHRLAFAAKCADLLRQGVAVTVIDIVTVPANDVVSDIVQHFDISEVNTHSSTNLNVTTMRMWPVAQKWQLRVWREPLQLGERLPTVPIWLRHQLAVPLDLESSYQELCRLFRLPTP